MPHGGEVPRSTRLRVLVESMRPQLRTMVADMLRGRLGEKLDPSDLVQEGLLTACEQLDSFHGQDDSDFHAWVAAIVRNKTLNAIRYWRQDRRNPRRELGPHPELHVADPGPSPSWRLLRKEQVAEILQLLDDAPQNEREVLRLRYLESLELTEIAARMGYTTPRTMGVLRRGLQRLRTRVERRERPGDDITRSH